MNVDGEMPRPVKWAIGFQVAMILIAVLAAIVVGSAYDAEHKRRAEEAIRRAERLRILCENDPRIGRYLDGLAPIGSLK